MSCWLLDAIIHSTNSSCLNHARLLMAVRVGGGAAGRSRSASAQRAPADSSNASPSLRVRDEPSQFARSSFIPGDGQPAARDALPTSGVLRAAEGHAARRGGLGARRWADIRQAARLACDTGVMVKLHDVEIHPLLTEDGQAFLSYDKENGGQCNRHDAGRGQKPSNTIGKASARELQRQQRSARRLLKFQEVKRFWLTAAQQLLHGDRAKLRNDVWTSWMRSRPTPPAPPVPVPAAAAVIAPAPGMRVRIVGVQARPELNGQSGTTGTFDLEKGRCAVRMPSGECIALKPANLEVLSVPPSPDSSSDTMADAWRAALDAEPSQKGQKRKPRSRAKRST